MEEEACTNFKSIRAKFQKEIQVRYRPALPEKPKRLPTSAVGRSGLITMSFSSAVEAKKASQPRVIVREDLKTPSGKRPVSFPSTTSGDGPNRQSLKTWHSPLVLPLSSEPKHDSSAPPSKSITSPLKCIMKPIPTPFSLTRVSVCGREIGKNGLGLVKKSGAFNVQMQESTLKTASTEAVEVQQKMVSNPGLLDHPPSPNDSLTDSSSGSVTHFFDQHVLSTLEKAKRKLCYKNLLVCGRPKGFYSSKAQAQLAESPGSCHQETSPLKINGASKITVMEQGGVMQSEKACKPLPDLATLGPSPSRPPRPPHVDLSKYKTGFHTSDPSEALTVESAPEAEIVATANASLEDASVPPPDFPDFDISAPEATDSNAINLAALDLEATEFPGFDSLPPPPPLPDEDDGLHLQAVLVQRCPSHFGPKQSEDALCQSLEDAGILTSATEPVTFDLRMNGSHASFNLSAEHQLPSEPMQNSSQQKRFHESFDNVYEDVETVPRFSFAQSSYKCKGAPKNPYADNGHVKEETWRNIWHVTQWSNAAEDQNGQHDGQMSLFCFRVIDGYISVMNVELNIKEMLELGKKVSQAAGRGQTNGDDLSVSSRSSHQNLVFTSSFTDDSEEWMYEDDTLSLSAENLSQIKATSMPEMFDSNSSAHHPSSDWSIEDMQTQEAESFQFADIDLLPPPALYADSL
ncbi:uncharacterized protein [Sinocyclocheilus grahami]|uniref:uncharacterized protein n=1 Tax=Sinocyclocheilus grahami TaxID=75366 RepID=UPI0007AD37E2|nr:PREDICTED: uncharacterized protein LOC107562847 [Sinocyclocheilus grahami]